MKFQFIDIDNCISDDAWRIRFINWDTDCIDLRYRDYHLLSAFDQPGNKHIIASGVQHIYVTAMPEEFRAMRQIWLNVHGFPLDELLMRPANDHRHSAALKRDMVQEFMRDNLVSAEEIVAAFDDRPDVVQMYCDIGLPGQLLSIHNSCAYTQPKVTK